MGKAINWIKGTINKCWSIFITSPNTAKYLLGSIISLALATAFGYFLGWIAQLPVAPTAETPTKTLLDNWETGSAIIRNVFFSLAGIGGAYGLWLATRRTKAVEIQRELEQQSHITGQFNNAVEQLGSDKFSVRLGGIYALWRIGEDSPHRDYPRILDILSVFIVNYDTVIERNNDNSEGIEEDSEGNKNSKPEIVTILELYKNRAENFRIMNTSLKLPYSNFTNMDVLGADFAKCDLNQANFSNTKFIEANFHIALMRKANLTKAIFFRANFDGADLRNANMKGITLNQASMIGARLSQSNLSDAKLFSVNFTSTSLSRSNLTWAILIRANLSNANLMLAKMSNANFGSANLTGANLRKANLEGADLSGVNFTNVKNLTQEQLDHAWAFANNHPINLPNGLIMKDLRDDDEIPF